jgi:hypothetical protein
MINGKSRLINKSRKRYANLQIVPKQMNGRKNSQLETRNRLL